MTCNNNRRHNFFAGSKAIINCASSDNFLVEVKLKKKVCAFSISVAAFHYYWLLFFLSTRDTV